MSEQDYQRGLRGGDCQNYDREHYKDWSAGKKEYERLEAERDFREQVEMDKYFEPADRLKRIEKRIHERDLEIAATARYRADSMKKEKERAFEDAESFDWGLFFGICVFAFIALIGGYVIIALIGVFGVTIPTYVAWIIPGIMVVYIILMQISSNKSNYAQAVRKYGKRDK